MKTDDRKTTVFDDTLSLTECKDGFWLYDKTRGMNLAMKAKTAEDAYFKAIKYYQGRLITVEGELKSLKNAVYTFIDTVTPEEESWQ